MCPHEIERPVEPGVPAPKTTPSLGERIARVLLTRSPLGALVRRVARIHGSVHAKLLGAFFLIALLLVAMAALSLQTIASVSRQSRLLDQARERVDASRQIEHALGLQMNFTRNALLLRDDATIESILRERNRFDDTLVRLEGAAPPGERDTIQQIRAVHDQVLATATRIAGLIRDGKADEAMALHLNESSPLYREVATLVTRVVRTEETGMGRLRDSVEATRRQAVLLMGGFAVASIFLALLLGFVISWSFILPVRQAEDFLGQVAKGDFSATISVPNRDEFGVLAARMNHMSRELQQVYEDQRILNVELERASKAKSDFLASMSHELRTPLNAILGFNEMLIGEIYGEVPQEQKQPLTDIQNSGKHLLRLINNVLDLSKIEAGRMDLALEDYLVHDTAESVRAALSSLAAQKGLDLVTAVAEDIPVARGDGGRITQCLMNLAGNALKFTQQGRIEIAADLRGGLLHFRVTDTGIGIPEDRLETIFAEFRQGDATIAGQFGGTGLGLSITKKFVEMHGGRIWVESQFGKGSMFAFTIPLRVENVEAA
jgi:signal transduction histidine kinase